MKIMTEKALNEAFAGESMAHMKYLAFGEIAEKDGYPKLANLFRAIAYAEQVHATNHARALGLLQKTADNLQTGIDGENFEVEEMYPTYTAIAELQGEKRAKRSIFYAIEAERIHAEMYTAALEKVNRDEDIEEAEVYVCPVCGHTHFGQPTEKCPICNLSPEKYRKF